MDLSKQAGFPFNFDFLTWELVYQKDFFKLLHSRIFTIKNKSIHKYYLNPVAVLITKIYATYWVQGKVGIWRDLPFKLKFVVLNKDYVGIETIKTKSIYTGEYSRLIDLLYGNVNVLMFPPELVDNIVDENRPVILASLETGSKIVVPAGYVYVIINATPSEPAIVLEVHDNKDKANKLFTKGRGAPFYYVLRNTSHEIVKNPKYRFANRYVKLNKGVFKVLKKFNVSPKTPILKQMGRKSMVYERLLQTDKAQDILKALVSAADEVVDFSHPTF